MKSLEPDFAPLTFTKPGSIKEILIITPNKQVFPTLLTVDEVFDSVEGFAQIAKTQTGDFYFVHGTKGQVNDFAKRLDNYLDWQDDFLLPRRLMGPLFVVPTAEDGKFDREELKWLKLALFYSEKRMRNVKVSF